MMLNLQLRRILASGILLLLLTINTHADIHAESATAAEKTLQIGRGSIEWVDWRADGEAIMVSTVNGAWLYTPELQDIAHIPDARLARFSPDGHYIAGVDDGHTVWLWDARTFEPVRTFEGSALHIVRQLAWSPDSHYLAVAGADGVDKTDLWDVESDYPYTYASIYFSPADSIAWSPRGSYLGGLESKTGKIWAWSIEQKAVIFSDIPTYPPDYGSLITWQTDNQLTRGSFVDTLMFTTTWDVSLNTQTDSEDVGSTGQLVYSPNGLYLAAANIGGGLVIDTIKHQTIFTESVDQPNWGANVVAWSPDGHQLAGGSAFAKFSDLASVWVADPFTRKIIHTFKDHHECVRMIRWHPRMTALLSAGCNGDLVIHSLSEGGTSYQSREHTTITNTLAWKNDATHFAIADAMGHVDIRDSNSGESLITLNNSYPVRKIIWQPGGDLLATWSTDAAYEMYGMVRVWSTVDGKTLTDFNDENKVYFDMDWSPDGNFLAGTGNSIKVWDIDKPSQSYEIPVMETISAENLKWSPDAKMIAASFFSSGSGGGVYIYDTPSGNRSDSIVPGYASTWIWTPDNHLRWLNWGSYGDIGYPPPIIEPATGLDDWANVQWKLQGMSSLLSEGYLSPHGSFAAVIGENHGGLVWSMTTGDVLFTIGDIKNILWSPDETMLAIRRIDNQIWILNVDGTVLIRLSDDITGVAVGQGWSQIQDETVVWSPDSQHLAHVYGGTVAIWNINK